MLSELENTALNLELLGVPVESFETPDKRKQRVLKDLYKELGFSSLDAYNLSRSAQPVDVIQAMQEVYQR